MIAYDQGLQPTRTSGGSNSMQMFELGQPKSMRADSGRESNKLIYFRDDINSHLIKQTTIL
jgi:hypothetical protein